MGSVSGKGDLRAAARHLERGIARWGLGDVAGALVEIEEALKLYPSASRGPEFAEWVKKVHASVNWGGPPALDEEALRAVNEALEPPAPPPPTPMETAATMTLPQPPVVTPRVTRDPAVGESPWDPVPLTPRGTDAPPEVREAKRRVDQLREFQTQETKAAAPPPLPPAPPRRSWGCRPWSRSC